MNQNFKKLVSGILAAFICMTANVNVIAASVERANNSKEAQLSSNHASVIQSSEQVSHKKSEKGSVKHSVGVEISSIVSAVKLVLSTVKIGLYTYIVVKAPSYIETYFSLQNKAYELTKQLYEVQVENLNLTKSMYEIANNQTERKV